MEIPNHLSHKPIIRLEEYSAIDGKYANKTDAQGLSIGLAQWNNPNQTDLSAKVWRYTDKKWSRQSEELPLHRALDLASLVCSAIYYADNHTLPKTDLDLTLAKNPQLITTLKDVVNEDKSNLKESLLRLKNLLNQIDFID